MPSSKNSTEEKERRGVRTWITIDSSALLSNIKTFRSIIAPNVMLMSVVKSNAYGHGLWDISKHVVEYGTDWIGVDTIAEGLRLRKEGIKTPILVLGYTLPEMISVAAEHDLSISVSHVSTLDAIKKINLPTKIKIHVKVDTGMHRQGFIEQDRNTIIAELCKMSEKITVEGLFTHFSDAKNPSFPAYTNEQIAKFEAWRKLFTDTGFSPIVHASATSGTILFPEAHYDMVRIGIGLYGLWPSKEIEAYVKNRITLKPILEWKTIVSETKPLPAGSKISYGGTETLVRDSIVGVCPIGYWHGFPRALSSIGEVLINGKRARVLGIVAMDMIVVDLTDCGNVTVGDVVVLIGSQGKDRIGAEQFAYIADASWYEIITRINPLIKKIFI